MKRDNGRDTLAIFVEVSLFFFSPQSTLSKIMGGERGRIPVVCLKEKHSQRQ
jgi:hypothetical protein